MPYAEVGGRQIFYLRSGTGEPLLLVQGMSGTPVLGRGVPAAVGADYEVVVYDHRGIGTSDRAEQPFSIADLADDAAGLITSSAGPRHTCSASRWAA